MTIWMLIDATEHFKDKKGHYCILKGSKGIREFGRIEENEFLLIYDTGKKQLNKIYKVTGKNYLNKCIKMSYIDKLDEPIEYKELKKCISALENKRKPASKLKYNTNPILRNRAILTINTNDWEKLRGILIEKNHRFSELIRLLVPSLENMPKRQHFNLTEN